MRVSDSYPMISQPTLGKGIINQPEMVLDVAHDGLGETVRRFLGVFYADYGMLGSCDSDWLHHTMKVLFVFLEGMDWQPTSQSHAQ